LLYDEELESRFNLVKNNYDSTLYYFRKYRDYADRYPPFQFDQQLSFNTIQTYRLDGLVIQTDFLVDNIQLWDYASWVEQVKKVINTEISQLRNDIEKIESTLSNSFSILKSAKANDSINIDPIENKSIYKIRKYDLNSPVANLFQYKDAKLDMLNERKSLALYDTAEEISLQVKLYTINRVFQQTISLENSLVKYNSELAKSNLNKNKDFYEDYYGGIDQFKNYFKTEENELLAIRKETANKLKSQIINYYQSSFTQEKPLFRNIQFEWQNPILEYDSLSKNIAYINYSASNVNELEYFSGYYFNTDSISQAFIAAKNKEKVVWYNAVPSKYKANMAWQKVMDINVVAGGDLSYLLYESHNDSLDFVNQIVVANEKGEIKNKIEINTQEKPVKLTALRNSNLQLAFYQGDGLGDAVWPNKLTVVKFHPDSVDYSSKEIDINGKLRAIFQTDAGLILVSSSEDGRSLFTSLFDDEFNSLKKASFNFSKPVDVKYNYQISENSLHLLNPEDGNGHLVLTDELELGYSDIPQTIEGI
jgi:hypothetical protein